MTTETQTRTRICANPECSTDISNLSKLTRFCRPCAYHRRREVSNESARRLRGTGKIAEPKTTEKRIYCGHYFKTESRTSFEDDDGTKHFICIPCWRKMLDD